jgi:hypothetical protein
MAEPDPIVVEINEAAVAAFEPHVMTSAPGLLAVLQKALRFANIGCSAAQIIAIRAAIETGQPVGVARNFQAPSRGPAAMRSSTT